MTKNHLKTHRAPRTWNINRKEKTFVTRPHPSGHKKEMAMPLNIVLRDILGKAKTKKEVKKILHDEEVLINGTRRGDHASALGLLDLLSIPKIDEHYIVLINSYNRLYLKSVDKKDAEHKLSKITGKKIIRKGIMQLSTLDGRSILVKKDTFKTGDSVLLSIPKQEIKDTFKFEKGAAILLYKGKYVGTCATVEEIKGDVLTFKKDEQLLNTKTDYAIVIGKDKPLIKIE